MRVIDPEGRADQVVDEVDLAASHIIKRNGIDEDGGAGFFDRDIVIGALALAYVTMIYRRIE